MYASDVLEYASTVGLTATLLVISKGWMVSRYQLKRKTKILQASPSPNPDRSPSPNPSPNPSPSPDQVAFWAIPLLGCGACALPHFRALFSAARPARGAVTRPACSPARATHP